MTQPIEMDMSDMPRSNSRGPARSSDTATIAVLEVGKGLMWEACPDHTFSKKSSSCRAYRKLKQFGLVRGFRLSIYHTKDGALCVIRLA